MVSNSFMKLLVTGSDFKPTNKDDSIIALEDVRFVVRVLSPIVALLDTNKFPVIWTFLELVKNLSDINQSSSPGRAFELV